MVDYTTVRIKKSSLEKINKMKGADGTVADVIEKLLSTVDGCTIDDIQEIERYSVAIRLEYTVFDGNKNFSIKNEYGITYQELKLGKVGDEFTANLNPTDDEYMLDTAKILYVDGRSVLVRVTSIVKDKDVELSEVQMVHVDLF